MNTTTPLLNTILHGIRKDYTKGNLNEDTVNEDPFQQFEFWLKEAIDGGNHHANAMTLSTVDKDLQPDARVVLLKDISEGGFTFFTNYTSKKAQDMESHPKASLLFFWSEMERQIRIQGVIKRLSEKASDEYFETRPYESKVGALASKQSQKIASRAILEELYAEKLKEVENKSIVRPANWGGYVLIPSKIEFWQGRPSRLHDRICFTLQNNKIWQIERLMP